MKLSIIVPVYKVRRHLQRCIESILQQTYTDYELILVDDGSPDNCGAICDRYAQECDKVKVIHKKNGGLSSARNAGLAAAQGEYITFVDGDDTVASGTYYYNMRILLSNPDIDILEYPVTEHYETPQSNVVSFSPQKITGSESIFRDWIKRKGYMHCYACNKIYRAELFFFVRYPEGEVFEDILTTPMLIESSRAMYYSDAGFYYYHDNNEGISHKYSFKSLSNRYNNMLTLYKKIKYRYAMHQESHDMLLRTLDCLTDLLRCSDGSKEEQKTACAQINAERMTLSELYRKDLPAKRKIKYTTFALLGASAHCRLYAMLKKKLC